MVQWLVMVAVERLANLIFVLGLWVDVFEFVAINPRTGFGIFQLTERPTW